jgi:hypothetical protein
LKLAKYSYELCLGSYIWRSKRNDNRKELQILQYYSKTAGVDGVNISEEWKEILHERN